MLAGIRDAQAKIAAEQPDRIITIGGNCMVSLAAFDTLDRVFICMEVRECRGFMIIRKNF